MTDLITAVKEKLRGRKVLIVGDLVADQFLSGSISRVSREAPVFILRHEETETRPGAAANAAANVASLGGTPILVGIVGDDENGRLLRTSLERSNVDTANVIVGAEVTTTAKVRVLAAQHYSVRQQVIRIDYESPHAIGEDARAKLAENLGVAAEAADAIIVSDYGYGVVDRTLFEEIRKIAHSFDLPLVVDSRYRLDEFPGATAATPNQEEVEQILGAGFTNDDCTALCEKLGFRSLVVTRGNKGMTIIEPESGAVDLPAIGPTQPVDVTGAGDTVIAAYSLALAAGLNFRDAAAIANHAGGIVVMKKGTATATTSELIASLSGSDAPALASDFAA